MSNRLCLLLLSSLGLAGCDSDAKDTMLQDDTWSDSDVSGVMPDLALRVELAGADAYNPNGDGSGVVQLLATAEDAVRFTFAIDEQDAVESTSGSLEQIFAQEGTHAYPVTVTAYTDDGESASVTESVTVYYSSGEFPTLTWADEFDTPGAPDPEKWHHQVLPPDNGGWFNGEQQHYTDREENSYVSDGTLKIVALRESYTTEGSQRSYTSARINSMFAFTYGRVEIRARLPGEGGTWPALWTLGANVNERGNPFGSTYGSVGWPACGEIDIMEQVGWDKSRTLAYFHWGDTVTGAYGTEGGDIVNTTSTTDFHVYTLLWTAASLDIFVDDALVYSLENTAARPYDNPHYLLLNIAMGGNLGGDIPSDFTQATMEIDYVRVYQ